MVGPHVATLGMKFYTGLFDPDASWVFADLLQSCCMAAMWVFTPCVYIPYMLPSAAQHTALEVLLCFPTLFIPILFASSVGAFLLMHVINTRVLFGLVCVGVESQPGTWCSCIKHNSRPNQVMHLICVLFALSEYALLSSYVTHA